MPAFTPARLLAQPLDIVEMPHSARLGAKGGPKGVREFTQYGQSQGRGQSLGPDRPVSGGFWKQGLTALPVIMALRDGIGEQLKFFNMSSIKIIMRAVRTLRRSLWGARGIALKSVRVARAPGAGPFYPAKKFSSSKTPIGSIVKTCRKLIEATRLA